MSSCEECSQFIDRCFYPGTDIVGGCRLKWTEIPADHRYSGYVNFWHIPDINHIPDWCPLGGKPSPGEKLWELHGPPDTSKSYGKDD